jgi:hypothetical protein
MANKSGIHIKPSHEGRFTEWAHRHGFSSPSEAISAGLKSRNPDVVKMANFARNAKKFKHGK